MSMALRPSLSSSHLCRVASNSTSNADRGSGAGADSSVQECGLDPDFGPGEEDKRLKGREKRE